MLYACSQNYQLSDKRLLLYMAYLHHMPDRHTDL